jgi:hypothetical protein
MGIKLYGKLTLYPRKSVEMRFESIQACLKLEIDRIAHFKDFGALIGFATNKSQ